MKGSFYPHLQQSYTLNCKGSLLEINKSLIMGILNVSQDSFYDGGKFIEENSMLEKVGELVRCGAQIIDIGAASSRPGAAFISEDAEREALLPAIRLVSDKFPEVCISVDTWRAKLAREAIENGAHIINDISGGELDKTMFATVARLKVPYVLMHMKGTPKEMQEMPVYTDLLKELLDFFQQRISKLHQSGVYDIIIDPGFGFGKSLEQNYKILAHLDLFKIFNCPILTGFSRKSMVNKVLGTKPENALNGTSVLNTIALLHGANILRVHDAKEAMECIKIVNIYLQEINA